MHIRRYPKDFPDPAHRKKRVLEELPVAPPPPPKALTREEITAENRMYRRQLNLLKNHLQPILDQIKRRYKSFRSPAIPASEYQYLFDEANPNYVRPDVANAPPRPYALAKDENGTPGLLKTDTNVFFYNLDTVTIEERLANGYYINPDAFLKDIKSLEHDAKHAGDRATWLKANELGTNVDVDIAEITEKFSRAVDWDYEWKREQFRRRELKRIEKKEKEARQTLGGKTLREPVNGQVPAPKLPNPVTPRKLHTTTAQFQLIADESSTNGQGSPSRSLANGTSVPSRATGQDLPMVDVDSPPAVGPHLSMQPPSQWPPIEARSTHTSVRATTGGTNQFSQVSAVQSLPPGVSPSALVNDASTTKTTDPSHRSSNFSTQATNGTHNEQSSILESNPDNNIPDTQPYALPSQATSGDEPWVHSQFRELYQGSIPHSGSSPGSHAHTSPVRGKSSHVASMANLLNDPSPDEQSQSQSQSQSQRQLGSSASQQVELDETQAQFFLDQVTERTSGCTIEQLQQIYREMMVELWRTRGEHNRMKVLNTVTRVFNEAINDIESVQGLLQPSQ